MLPDFERADRIGDFWGYPQSRTFAELLIDCGGGPDLAGGAGRHAAGDRPVAASGADRGAVAKSLKKARSISR